MSADLLELATRCRKVANDRDMLPDIAEKALTLFNEYEELVNTHPNSSEERVEFQKKKKALNDRMEDFLHYR